MILNGANGMKTLYKTMLASSLAVGLLTALPSANAAMIVGDLTLDDFGTPDLSTFSASLNYDYTAMCFDGAGSGTVGICGADNGLKGPNKVTYDGSVDVTSSFGVLTIDGTTMAVDTGSSYENVTGTYNLTANFTGAGLFDASGSSVTAVGSSASFAGPDFLTADLTDFGFAGDAGSFELLFAAVFTSGDFATTGTLGGVHIFNNTALGDWQSDWSSTGVSVNTAVLTAVPVPAAAWLFGSGLLAFAGVARRQQANKI